MGTGLHAEVKSPTRAGIIPAIRGSVKLTVDTNFEICIMTPMQDNSMPKKKVTDPIAKAVFDKMSAKGKGFFIISCGPWIHPLNTILNCYAIMFDGFIQYKFELCEKGYKMAEIKSTYYLGLRAHVGDIFTTEELITLIKEGF